MCGTSTEGKLGTDIESSVAYVSYLPLCGKGETVGDGIVPAEIAFLEGARSIRLPNAKHAGFIPTAGPSIKVRIDSLCLALCFQLDTCFSSISRSFFLIFMCCLVSCPRTSCGMAHHPSLMSGPQPYLNINGAIQA